MMPNKKHIIKQKITIAISIKGILITMYLMGKENIIQNHQILHTKGSLLKDYRKVNIF